MQACEILVGRGKRSEEAARRLLEEVVSAASPDLVTAMAGAGTPERRVLLRSRFLKLPHSGPLVTMRPLEWTGAVKDLGKWSRWRLGIGDLELF